VRRVVSGFDEVLCLGAACTGCIMIRNANANEN